MQAFGEVAALIGIRPHDMHSERQIDVTHALVPIVHRCILTSIGYARGTIELIVHFLTEDVPASASRRIEQLTVFTRANIHVEHLVP